MKNTALYFTALLFGTFAAAQNVPKTLLWEVTKGGSTHKSYLFGTFHDVTPAFFNTLSNAVSKLNASDILFVEEQRSPASDSCRLKNFSAWSMKEWKAFLSPQQDSTFSAFVAKADDSMYYRLSPFYLTLVLGRLYMQNFCETDTVFDELMDHYIEKLALKGKKTVRSLDEKQMKILQRANAGMRNHEDSVYAATGIELMQNMLNNDVTGCEVMNTYKRFEVDYKLDSGLTGKPDERVLLIERNNRWLRILDAAFSRESCFVAVGLRHLFYKQGLVQLLRSRGYTVKPIPG